VAPSTAAPSTAAPSTVTTIPPTTPAAFTNITDDSLSKVFVVNAFQLSTTGYTFEASTSAFTVPDQSDSQVVLDTRIGPTNAICRGYPQITMVCVSNACTGCNVATVTADVRKKMENNPFNKIIYPGTSVGTKYCATNEVVNRYGIDIRYVVINPSSKTDSASNYKLSVTMSGSFPAYNCPNTRRRRRRQAEAATCVCPIGQDPVLPAARAVAISWRLPKLPFDAQLSKAPN
uniref:DUF1573 domain-containing protein n=1 Tax=Macrostomum lignano TaxID=282301 RepID=A0A1I8IRC1_9PLAT